MDFSQFRNNDIVHIIENAASISIDLGLMYIEPISIFVSLNQCYTVELARYIKLL